jgi:hypothetical protein
MERTEVCLHKNVQSKERAIMVSKMYKEIIDLVNVYTVHGCQ